jgi:hypothetical protein
MLVAAFICLAAGCASSIVHPTPYPAEWPERSGRANCQITGVYQDFGEVQSVAITSPDLGRGHLRSLLRAADPGWLEDPTNPDVHVWLDRDSPKMRVGSEEAKTEQLRSEGEIKCQSDGGLVMRFESDSGSAYRHSVLTVWPASEGSLIVRVDMSFTEKGLPFLPDAYDLYWFRFKPVAP